MKLKQNYLKWKLKRSLEKNPQTIKVIDRIYKIKEYMGRYQIVYQDVERGKEPLTRSYKPLYYRYSMNSVVFYEQFIKDWYKDLDKCKKDLELFRKGEKLIDVD